MDTAVKINPGGRRCRHAMVIAALAPLIPQVLGSAFNIWYNALVIKPLLATDALKQRFVALIIVYNVIVFPAGIAIWVRLVFSLKPIFQALCDGGAVPEVELNRQRRRLIQLPISGATISAVAWLLFIPAFFAVMFPARHELDPVVFWHMPISILISAAIAITHSFFLIELASHWGLFPTFFSGVRADLIPGVTAISLRARGVLWAISAGICPIGSLLLLSFAPPLPSSHPQWFALFVGSIGIAFGLCTAVMISRLVANPIDLLRAASQNVARGQLDVAVSLPRADEFGALGGEFNHMVAELREKERLRETFGLHVGRAAAEQILARDPGLNGIEQVITVMFVDIRGFTARTASSSPPEVLRELNEFLRVMVRVVEEDHGGMIQKFLGDGFLALFGVTQPSRHADKAVEAGRSMLRTLAEMNHHLAKWGREPFRIGIGIHTGPAIVGNIGSPKRLEFTAIGNTVNLAARVEQLTKVLGATMLMTQATVDQLSVATSNLKMHPPQDIRGLSERVAVYSEG